MKINNNLNQKIIINLIYYLSIYVFSLFYLVTINSSHIIDIKGFSYSYLLGILIIVILSIIFTHKIHSKKTELKTNLKNNNDQKTTLLFLLFISIYIISFIKFIKIPLNIFNISTGIINSTIYSSKILLYSGVSITLNLYLETMIKNKHTLIQIIIKLSLFLLFGLIFLNLFKYKGLLYTISTLEVIHLISNLFFLYFKQ